MRWNINYIAITNQPEVVSILERCGINQIMVDAEKIGKAERQNNKNTIISSHEIADVGAIKSLGLKVKVICRINPFNDSSFQEIDQTISHGADFIMIPMIKDILQYQDMVNYINDRIKIIPLIETTYSLFKLKEIIQYSKIEQIHFGLNDLFIEIGFGNLFETLISDFFECFIKYAVDNVKIVGVGGIGNPLMEHKVSATLLLAEYLQLHCNSVILSRSFFDNKYNECKILESLTYFENVFENTHKLRDKRRFQSQVLS
jgi:2-keto-3-deoxy-L-rhamnonate aldolase RhmA